jgi:hypothetical protein
MTAKQGGHRIAEVTLPRRSRGRPTAEAAARFQTELERFARRIIKINSSLDFRVSSRGWCYILEEQGLPKGDFDAAQDLINDCRKRGVLPLDICCEDGGRQAEHLESIDQETPAEFAAGWIEYVHNDVHNGYTPKSFWEDLDVYVEMTVEKIDLKSLFSSVCAPFHIPLTNISGWNDINSRAAIMRRFASWERRGKRCVLLHCGDHDPGGLHISDFLRANFEELAGAVGWHPRNLTIERFGLNADFIQAQGLTWIDNLETSSGGRLDDPRHPDHQKPYVQSYLQRFGARKVEANALVIRPRAGRDLCRRAILRYVWQSAVTRYERDLASLRDAAQSEIARLLRTWSSP